MLGDGGIVDHIVHEHTGLDTGDSGNYECKEDPIISAAAWAGEKGGVSCNSTSSAVFLIIVIISLIIIASRAKIK